MAPDFPRLVRRATFALLVSSSPAATEVAAVETRPVLSSLGLAALWVGVAAILGLLARPPQSEQGSVPRYVGLPILLLLGAIPFAIEPLRRQWGYEGYPLELQMVFSLQSRLGV